jgi:hypothetical protein
MIMQTLRFFIAALLVLFVVNSAFSQPATEDYIKLLVEKVMTLEKDRSVLTDLISQKDNRINTLQVTNKKLVIDRNAWKLKAERSERQNIKLGNRVVDYAQKVAEITNLNEEIEALINESNKSTLRNQLSDETAKSKKLESDLLNRTMEIEQLQRAENEKYLLLREKIEWEKQKNANALEIAKLKEKELEATIKSKDESLALFKGFKEHAMKLVVIDIPKLINGDRFYDSGKEIETHEKTLNMIRSVVQNDGSLNTLSNNLVAFKETCEVLQKAKAVLKQPYEQNTVTAMMNELNTFKANASNPYYQQEKNKLLNLLNNYCFFYATSYDWFKNLNTIGDNSTIIIENIVNFKEYQDKEIQMYNEYSYIRAMVDSRENNPTNSSIILPNRNTPCN